MDKQDIMRRVDHTILTTTATWEQKGATWEVVYSEAINTGITCSRT